MASYPYTHLSACDAVGASRWGINLTYDSRVWRKRLPPSCRLIRRSAEPGELSQYAGIAVLHLA